MEIKITKLPKSEVEIEGAIGADVFESYFKKAVSKLGEDVKIDGFRPGKVPEDVLLKNIPEIRVLEEMAELALAEHYPKIIAEQKLDVISRPEIAITKIARGNPLEFKIKTTIMPEIVLADYKDISKKVLASITDAEKSTAINEEELEKTILDIRKSRAKKIDVKDIAPHEHKEGEEHDHSHEPQTSDIKNSPMSDVEPELPEFNDEFVQAMGPFENVNDFRKKLQANMELEKANMNKEKTRLKIVEEIMGKSPIEVPEVLIALELDKILYRMEADITQMGMKFEDYLKHLNKTVEELRTEFRPDAEKKAKLGLVLNKISENEKISADEEEVEKEVAHILEHYKEADPERARIHSHNILTNEKIFQFLENQ